MFIDFFPSVVFCETLSNFSLDEIKEYKQISLKEIMYKDGSNGGNISENQHFLNNSYLSKLKNEILKRVKDFSNEIGYKHDEWKISSSWVNILNKGDQITTHNHSNSFLSGCFYPSSDNSNINFSNPLMGNWAFNLEDKKYLDSNNPRTWDSSFITPQIGTLIIFPSWLKHSVSPSKHNNRISIAFNLIPSGEFGPSTSRIKL